MSYKLSLKMETDKYIILVSASNTFSKVTVYDSKTLQEVDDPELVECIKNIKVGDLI